MPEESLEQLCRAARDAIMSFDEEESVKVAEKVIAAGVNPVEIITLGFTPAMVEVGRLFEQEELSLPYVIVAAEGMQKAVEMLEPHFPPDSSGEKLGTVVIGTCEGDIHDIGKGIVATMLRIYGFEVHDLGRDVPPKLFVEKAKELKADIIASSTLMTTTMIAQKAIEEILLKEGLKGKIKTMVGGAPVNQNWANKIGSGAYGENASEAVEKARELL
ncbi:MAG TPA: dimethylamine corrinoid protein 3 [Firmicutes bacterium]|nr:dimethylamine corrinoid protein 3 [Bacillota bacterium]